MENKEKYLRTNKRLKIGIIVFSVLSVVMLIGNKSYALFSNTIKTNNSVVSINTSKEFPTPKGVNELKKTLGKEGGLIGITNDNQKVTTEVDNIREYRYSGLNVNNYVYFNCKDNTTEQNATNCETWRIIGVFKDESGSEHIKIIRSERLTAMVYNDQTNRNWTYSKINTYLNGTYFISLSSKAQGMIADVTYYLGLVTEGATTTSLYSQERAGNNNWFGKIALMYPSDLGFSLDSSKWKINTDSKSFSYDTLETSWMHQSFKFYTFEWFISPNSKAVGYYNYVALLANGSITYAAVGNSNSYRPTLYLKSNTQIIDGKGTAEEPYQLLLDYIPTAAEKIKSRIAQNDGLVGVPISCGSDNGSCNVITSDNPSLIREHRYYSTNVNNYIYFNCKSGSTYENANNTCEKWRIVGVFKDENGVEMVKIVQNNVIPSSSFPETYEVDGTVYKIKSSKTEGDYVYWNLKEDDTYNNDWTTAGLQYWLNSKGKSGGFLNSLSTSAKEMIAETKWYLGWYQVGDFGYTTVTAYKVERSETSVYKDNQATWIGKIGLLYPSDYGFTSTSNFWTTRSLYEYNTAFSNWFNNKETNHYGLVSEWLLSPKINSSEYVAYWSDSGLVGTAVTDQPNFGARATLYLKPETLIIAGDGKVDSCYYLSLG